MSLTDEDRAQFDEIRAHYPDTRAAAVSVMKWIQRRHGYISDESLRDAAGYLGLPAADLEGLATFYNLLFRQPVGRNVIKICDSVSCWMCGHDDIKHHLQERLGIGFGETTPDGEFTLLPVVCLGHCDHAPAMMVNDDLVGRLTPARVDELLGTAARRATEGSDPHAAAAAGHGREYPAAEGADTESPNATTGGERG